jgi:hypothetical protein
MIIHKIKGNVKNMNTKNINLAMVFVMVIAMMLVCIPIETVLATGTPYTFDFQDGVVGSRWYNSTILGQGLTIQTVRCNGSAWGVSGTFARSGSKSFCLDVNHYGTCNLTYSKTFYLTDYKMYEYFLSDNKYFFFYNQTHQGHMINPMNASYSNSIIMLYTNGNNMYSFDNVGATHYICGGLSYNSWSNYWGFNITSAFGDVDYYGQCSLGVNGVYHGSACNPTAIANGWRIDRIIMKSDGSPSYIDDVNFTLSTSYTPGGGGIGSYTDLSSYSNVGNGFNYIQGDGHDRIYSKYLEFIGFGPFTGTTKGLELLVSDDQVTIDSNPANYYLYINGNYMGSAHYIGPDSETPIGYDVIQWIFTGTVTGTPIYEFYHTTGHTFPGELWPCYWSLAHSYNVKTNGWPSGEYLKHGSLNMIDGIWNQVNTVGYSWRYRLYYSVVNESGTNPKYTPSINLIGFNTHPQYHIPYTLTYTPVIFNTFVNTSGYFKINVTLNGIDIGATQHYPAIIDAYKSFFTFVATTQGNYTVGLYHNGAKILSRAFNVTNNTGLEYALYGSPDPSPPNSGYMIFVYAHNPLSYPYYKVCGFIEKTNVNIPSKADDSFSLTSSSFTNSLYSTFADAMGLGDSYWMLFGSSDNNLYVPLIPAYTKHVTMLGADYIRATFRVSPMQPNAQAFVNVPFTLYGVHSNTFITSAVFRGTGLLKTITGQSDFTFSQTETIAGTYVYYLKEKHNDSSNVWTTIDSVTVTVSTYQTPGNNNNLIGNLVDFIPVEYRLYAGIGVIIAFFMLPIGLIFAMIGTASKHGVTLNVPGTVTMILSISCGITGYILTIIWGLMPWYSVFILLFVLILVLAIMWLGRGRSQDT